MRLLKLKSYEEMFYIVSLVQLVDQIRMGYLDNQVLCSVISEVHTPEIGFP